MAEIGAIGLVVGICLALAERGGGGSGADRGDRVLARWGWALAVVSTVLLLTGVLPGDLTDVVSTGTGSTATTTTGTTITGTTPGMTGTTTGGMSGVTTG